jgi:hypothetical protein
MQSGKDNVTTLEKGRSWRCQHPELRRDDCEGIYRMPVEQPFQEDRPAMMIAGGELANV